LIWQVLVELLVRDPPRAPVANWNLVARIDRGTLLSHVRANAKHLVANVDAVRLRSTTPIWLSPSFSAMVISTASCHGVTLLLIVG
jgi:hypothetical protein